jgi:phosphomannomutase
MIYLFDIDGTLTPSRLRIDPEFEQFFLQWMKDKDVIFVTGSDKDKTIEQVGEKIWTRAQRIYQSCGNAVYQGGQLIHKNQFDLSPELKKLLLEFVMYSDCPKQFDNHIEERIGLVNFSPIGRSCPQEAREEYYKWDTKVRERETFCKKIEEMFPELEATVGGQISIDIYPKGQNKAQVLEDLVGDHITFFGDKCEPGGNDYPIVAELEKQFEETIRHSVVHRVKDYKETWNILKIY